ncbi:MAG: DNRLRE domain-containing protein [Verrucomicrobia bacterium]|nr:DNRLRE domain-containing protein [Verrucomicrobiota bacterium]
MRKRELPIPAFIATTIITGLLNVQAATTYTFQEGVKGYAGTKDTHIRFGSPDRDDGQLDSLNPDKSAGGGEVHGFMRFDNMFGPGPGQIPSGSVIFSATLTLYFVNPGNSPGMHRILKPWDESTTWNSWDPVNADGITADGVEAAIDPDVTFDVPGGVPYYKTVDLPPKTIQDWLDGKAPNYGWGFIPSSTDGIDFDSSEGAVVEQRPKMTIVAGSPDEATKISITEQPQDAKQEPGGKVTFSVKISPLPLVTYQWLKNGTAIAGATSTSYTTPDLAAADNGAKFKVRITAGGNSVESREAVVTVVTAAKEVTQGFLKAEVFTGIGGTALDGLRGDAKYTDNKPDAIEFVNLFEYPPGTATTPPAADVMNNYGVRISGFIMPAETASYVFYLASDDNGELYLSTNESPANEALIASEPQWNPVRAFASTSRRPGCPDACENKSAPVRLEAGKRYWVRAEMKEGGGGDNLAVTWIKEGQQAPRDGAAPVAGAFLGAETNPNLASEITITEQPKDATVVAPSPATFTVRATASPSAPISIRWQRNGVNIPGASGDTYTTGFLTAADSGKIRAVVSVPGRSVNSSEATLTVQTDNVPPSIARVIGSDTFNQITVMFSEPVTSATAGDKANYSLDGGLTVSAATVVDSTTVKLSTSKQATAAPYTLTIKNIRDSSNNVTAADTKKGFTSFGPERGGLKFEAWAGITGNPVQNLLDDPRYPASPDEVAYVTSFDSRVRYPNDSHEAYGGRMSGWIVPAETGQYEFFIRSDDASQLFLSSDDDPAKTTMIAEETGCCGAFEAPGAPETSAGISLTSGKRYYIEALWKEGTGGDFCQVAWRKVGDTTATTALRPIPGQFLEAIVAPGALKLPVIAITSPADKVSVGVGLAVTVTVSATAGGDKTISVVEFFQDAKKIGEARTSPYTITIPNLPENIYQFTARATDSSGLSAVSPPVNVTIGAQLEKITLVAIDDKTKWRYENTGKDLGTAWKDKGYNDSAWPEGAPLLALETGAVADTIRTPLKRQSPTGQGIITDYFRTRFTLTSDPTKAKLSIRHVVDDGFVLYLNGTEVYRFSMPAGTVTATTAATSHENAYAGPFDIPVTALVTGENVLAAEVHQTDTGSSDVVFGLELIATVPAGAAPPPPAPQLNALLVVGTASDPVLNASDAGLKARLESQGWKITVVQAPKSVTGDADGKQLIITSSTVNSGDVGDKFRNSPVPVMNWEQAVQDNFLMTGNAGADHATTDAQTQINIVKADHPLAGGLTTGLKTVTTAPLPYSWGLPNANAVTIATIANNPAQVVVYGYEKGAKLIDGATPAPARRVMFFMGDAAFAALTPDGLKLFDAAVSWAADQKPAPSGPALSIARTAAGLTLTFSGTLQSADAVTGPWTDVANAASPLSVTVTGAQKFYRAKQ